MKLEFWFTGGLYNSRSAMSFYKRGITKARKHDHQGAIEDYTTSIDMIETPDDLRAMALYNRALVHRANGDNQSGIDDLETVLAMDEAPINVATMARIKLARIRKTQGQK